MNETATPIITQTSYAGTTSPQTRSDFGKLRATQVEHPQEVPRVERIDHQEENIKLQDFRTGKVAAEELTKTVKEEGIHEGLTVLAHGQTIKNSEELKEHQDTNLLDTGVEKNLEDKEDQYAYSQIRETVVRQKLQTDRPFSEEEVDQIATERYKKYQQLEQEKKQLLGETAFEAHLRRTHERLSSELGEKPPTIEGNRIQQLEQTVLHLSEKTNNLESQVAELQAQNEKMKDNLITTLTVLNALLLSELERRKKKKDEPSFIEMLVALVGKLLIELTNFDQAKSGEKIPKTPAQPLQFEAFKLDKKQSTPEQL